MNIDSSVTSDKNALALSQRRRPPSTPGPCLEGDVTQRGHQAGVKEPGGTKKHYLQEPKGGNNPVSTDSQKDGQAEYGV